ncbi:MAG: endonuclease/exonuclease/phosphatase family protein [Acidimicrobiia bacterium]|nr:endonuclease/exonuclease/phosphatase family protein [Acidimicrobiia bacterium]
MTSVEPFDPGFGPLVDTTVRVAAWNLWATYAAWTVRGPIIEAQLRAAAPDIALLVEVWDDPAGRSQAEDLARGLGDYEHVAASNLTFADGIHAGNAILSRWPIARSEVRTLPREAPNGARDDEGEERLCVFAEIDGPRGAIQVFCAHLSWREDQGAIRQEQVRAIAEFARETRPRAFPAILGGDLNAAPDTDEIRMLTGHAAVPVPGIWFRDVWVHAGEGPGYTWSNTNPWAATSLDVDRRIDYLLVGHPKLGGVGHPVHAELLGDVPVDGAYGSDHFGLVADLRY